MNFDGIKVKPESSLDRLKKSIRANSPTDEQLEIADKLGFTAKDLLGKAREEVAGLIEYCLPRLAKIREEAMQYSEDGFLQDIEEAQLPDSFDYELPEGLDIDA